MKNAMIALAVAAVLGICASHAFARHHGQRPHGGHGCHDQHVKPGLYYKPTPGHPMLYKPVPGHPWMTRPFAGHPWVPSTGHAHHYRPHYRSHYSPYYRSPHYRSHGCGHGRGGFSYHGPHGGFSIGW